MNEIFIVSSHYNENLDWIKNQKNYEYIIYSKNPDSKEIADIPSENLRIIKNRGLEATSYISFIIDFYERIPEYVAFCHGHEYAWHQSSDILSSIRAYNFQDEYFTLNNPYYRNSLYDECPQEIIYPAERRVWPKIKSISEKIGIELPDMIEITMSAQFVLKKECILRNSKSFYENLNDWLNSQTEITDAMAGNIMEQLWYLIFTGKSIEPRLISKTIMSERGYIE